MLKVHTMISNADLNDIKYGDKRAKLSWYSPLILFFTSRDLQAFLPMICPSIKLEGFIVKNYILLTDIAIGQTQVINTLDLTYYPKERGPYNNNSCSRNESFT
jgi:cell surface protein SprA